MRRAHRGLAAVELALTLPVVFALATWAVDYSRIFYTMAVLSDGARAGAIYYAANPGASISAVAQQALADASNLNPTPTVTTTSTTDSAGNPVVSVALSTTYSTAWYSSTSLYTPSSVQISRKVVMMVGP